MIYPKVVVTILCLSPFCVRSDDSEETNNRIEQFRQSISKDTGLNEDKKAAVLQKLKGFQDSLRTQVAGVDLGSKAGAQVAGVDLGSKAEAQVTGVDLGSKAEAQVAGVDLGSKAGAQVAGVDLGSKAEAQVAGVDLGSKAGAQVAGVDLGSKAEAQVAGVDLGSKAGAQVAGVDLGSKAGAQVAGVDLGSKAGAQVAGVDLGSKAGADHYKAEVSLLATYFKAGLPLDSGFGKWLKQDLDLQVDTAYNHLRSQTELTDKQRENRKTILGQLAYDLSNLGGSMTTEKMMEHTNWLEDNYEGFVRRRGHTTD